MAFLVLAHAAALLFVAWGTGAAVLRRLRDRPTGHSIAAATALGLTLLASVGIAMSALGASHSFTRISVFIFGAGATIVALAERGGVSPGAGETPMDPSRRYLLLACGVGAFTLLVAAFTVPVNYDVISYHLPLARRFEEALRGERAGFYGEMPLAVPAIVRLVLSEKDWGLGSALLLCGIGIVGATGCARIATLLGADRRWSLVASALWLWNPALNGVVLQGLSDGLTALIAMVALECVLLAIRGERPRANAALAGWMLGWATALKMSAGGIVAVPLGVLLVWGLWRNGGLRLAWAGALALGLAALLAVSPWMVRVAILTQSPIPSLVLWEDAKQAFVVNAHGPQTPLDGSYWRGVFNRTDVAGYALPRELTIGDGTYLLWPQRWPPIPGVPFLALGAALALRRRNALLAGAAGSAALGYAALLLVRDSPSRFFLPQAATLCAVAATIPAAIRSDRARTIVLALCAIPLLWHAGDRLLLLNDRQVAATPRAVEQWRGAILGESFLALTQEAARLSDEGRLAVLFDARAELFPRDACVSSVWDMPEWEVHLRAAARWPAAEQRVARLEQALAQMHIKALFVNEFEFGRALDFYSRDVLPGNHRGAAGVRSASFEAELAASPFVRIAALSEGEVSLLAAYLRMKRTQAVAAIPAGAVAEIWLAPVRTTGIRLDEAVDGIR